MKSKFFCSILFTVATISSGSAWSQDAPFKSFFDPEMVSLMKRHTIKIRGSETPELIPFSVKAGFALNRISRSAENAAANAKEVPVGIFSSQSSTPDLTAGFDNHAADKILDDMCTTLNLQRTSDYTDVTPLAALVMQAQATELEQRAIYYTRVVESLATDQKEMFDLYQTDVSRITHSELNLVSLSEERPDVVLDMLTSACGRIARKKLTSQG